MNSDIEKHFSINGLGDDANLHTALAFVNLPLNGHVKNFCGLFSGGTFRHT